MTRELLNTLFVGMEGAMVRLDGDTLTVFVDGAKRLQVPIHHLGSIYLFGSAHMTAPAMERCAEEGRTVAYFTAFGKFRFRVTGPICGNVLLRQAQYESQRDPMRTLGIARCIVAGKIQNQRALVLRAARDTKDETNRNLLQSAAHAMAVRLADLPGSMDLDGIRGVEGQVAALYFNVFGAMITVPSTEFAFHVRSRRPPRDRMNALLSFLYALLTMDCTAACEGVGLDPQFGFLHCLRPGRPALALDLMEEFRPLTADRLALSLVNRRQLQSKHFVEREGAGESVLLTSDGRKIVLEAYQKRKMEEVIHPLLKDKAPLGLLPHLQARLFARHLRGDLEMYLPFTA
ncbi:MAG: type I-C CRISPR-associated endonuclease Cas1 [Alphaproteobacteria bacterium]|nr:MAG: type I-C CRISPR-associated endonuclease Cas1 [Alphaproteobacteria bacterium]